MKTYWDSSALLDAILEQPSSRKRFLSKRQKITRCHTFAEIFSQLTGGRLGKRMDADEAAETLRSFAENMTVVSLDAKETFSALKLAKNRGVRGGAVHDFLHAYAAELHGCETIFTENINDFLAVTQLEISQP